jgi:hypothetical protein
MKDDNLNEKIKNYTLRNHFLRQNTQQTPQHTNTKEIA